MESTESTEFVAALRSTITAQSKEMDELRSQVLAMDEEREEEVSDVLSSLVVSWTENQPL